MVRSQWLRVHGMRLNALFRLAFATAPPLPRLSLAAYHDSQVYSTKDTPRIPSCTASCGPVVSGSLSLPSPGFFSPFPHGTIRYRWHWVFSLGSWSTRIHAGFLVPRATQVPHHRVPVHSAYGAVTLSGQALRPVPLCILRCLPAGHPRAALQPRLKAVWAPPRSLAATWGISFDFFSRVT